jgi:hypothetical protein
MKRIHEGLYTEEKTVSFNGRKVAAEFRVFRVKLEDPKNPKETIDSPFWSIDCPKLKILGQNVFEKKQDAMDELERICMIGFKTMPVTTTCLAIEPFKI